MLVYEVDLDLDSDHTHDYDGWPDGIDDRDYEDSIEVTPPTNHLGLKYVVVNDFCEASDTNGIPGYANFGMVPEYVPTNVEVFVEVQLTLPDPFDDPDATKIVFTYHDSAPSMVTTATQDFETVYLPESGEKAHVRLWMRDQPAVTNPAAVPAGDFIESGVEYTATQLGFTSLPGANVFYLEAVTNVSSLAECEITVAAWDSDEGDTACEDATLCTPIRVDVDVDSNNDEGYSSPERNFAEDHCEDMTNRTGKIITENSDNTDNDGLIDFADGYDILKELYGYTLPVDDDIVGERFVPIVFELPEPIDPAVAKVRLAYSDSNPLGVVFNSSGDAILPEGHLRIWTKDGAVKRNGRSITDASPMGPGDYVPAGVYTAGQFGFSSGCRELTYYLEAVMHASKMADGDTRIVFSVDPDGDTWTPPHFIAVDAVRTTVVDVDLDVDSDNNNGVAAPERDDNEDEMEEATGTFSAAFGKFVMVNHNDDDKDGVPDYADMQVAAISGVPGSESEGQFVPLVLEIHPDVPWSTAEVVLTYDGAPSLPAAAVLAGVDVGNVFTNYTGAKQGKMRLWKISSPGESRDAGKYIVPGASYTAGSLGFNDTTHEKTFYIEGMNPVNKSIISVTVTLGSMIMGSDRVVVTVVEPNLGVNGNENLVNGDGMRVGTPDVRFLIDDGNTDDEVIEDQRYGFRFWWSRDASGISSLGLADLCPFIVDMPNSLAAAGLRAYIATDLPLVRAYKAASPSASRRKFLLDDVVGPAQVALAGTVVQATSSAPGLLPITTGGRHEFVLQLPSPGPDPSAWPTLTGTVSLVIADLALGGGNQFAADGVKLTIARPYRKYLTSVSSRESTEPTNTWTYHIEDSRTQVIEKYKDPEPPGDSGPGPDLLKTQYLIYTHGFNVSEVEARTVFDEIFKRTYWCGFRGNFIGFMWYGDENVVPPSGSIGAVIQFDKDVKNAFQTSPALLNFLRNTVQGAPSAGGYGALVRNTYLWCHSLGGQVGLDALRLNQANPTTAGTKLARTCTTIEPAVWSETFDNQVGISYSFPSDPISYSVSQLKNNSWTFYFNQSGQPASASVDRMINCWHGSDYALWGMRQDEVLLRNPLARQYDRFAAPDDRHPYGGSPFSPVFWEHDLVHGSPAVLKPNFRFKIPLSPGTYTCGWWQVRPALGAGPSPLAGVVSIDAASKGWIVLSHTGFLGWDVIPMIHPLYRVSPWYAAVLANWGYTIGVE